MMLTQKKLLEVLTPVLKEKGKLFEKKSKVRARPANVGEIIYTFTSDGVETKNTAKSGDMLIENSSLEKYLVSKEQFQERYIKEKPLDDQWSLYLPKGKVFGLLIDEKILKLLEQPNPFHFIAPWGEKMLAKKDDFLVCPPDFSEIYRIAKKEFGETYCPVMD